LKPYEGPTLEPWAYKTPTPVERVDEVVGEDGTMNSGEVAGSSSSVATGSSVVLETEASNLGEKGSDKGLSRSEANNGELRPTVGKDNSMQRGSVSVGAKQDRNENEEKDNVKKEKKKRKKSVSFSPNVEVREIPLVGKGRKFVRKRKGWKVRGSWGRAEDRVDNAIQQWQEYNRPSRHNPDRVRRKPERYR
jgi:hypothetical protein